MSEVVHSPGIYSDARGGSSYINRANPGRTLVSTSAQTPKATPSPSSSSSPKAILSLKDILPSAQTDSSIPVGSDFADSRVQMRDIPAAVQNAQVAKNNPNTETARATVVEDGEYQDIYAREESADQINPYLKKERIDPYERHNKRQSVTIKSLSDEELSQVRDMQNRDREVRSHETAHLTAAGTLAKGGIRYEYEQGPDGRRYIVDGHVQIDTSPGNTPEETISKARQIRAAALASNDPSSADMSVASMAIRMEMEARQELQNSQTENIPEPEGLPDSATSRMVDTSIGSGAVRLESNAPTHTAGAEHLKQCQECLQKAFGSSGSQSSNTTLLGWG